MTTFSCGCSISSNTSAVKKEAYLQEESKSALDRLFEGSPKSFVAALVLNDKRTDEDLKELGKYLQEVRKGRG